MAESLADAQNKQQQVSTSVKHRHRQQKQHEYGFALAASRLLNVQWQLVPRGDESEGGPDFIVHQKNHSFGLEVHEIFKGVTSKGKGAALKRKQAEDQLRIDGLRRQYEDMMGDIPLYVKFLDTPDKKKTNVILNELYKMNLQEKSFPYDADFTIQQENGLLKIFVSRLPDGWQRDRLYYPDWFIVADVGGFVETSSAKISKAVRAKSEKLDRYKRNVANGLGLSSPLDADVRLLLVADHMWAYGKVELNDEWIGNNHGFSLVYFLQFPEAIKAFQRT